MTAVTRLPEGSTGEKVLHGMLRMRFAADGPSSIAGAAGCAESTVRRWLPLLADDGWVQRGAYGWWTATGKAMLAYPEIERQANPYRVA